MKALKIYLSVGLILLLIAMCVVGYVWLKLQSALTPTVNNDSGEVVDFVKSEQTPVANTVPQEGIKLNSSAISVEQKAVAEKVGIDLDAVVVTPEMISCAEQKLGSERIQEIMNGASPTTLESMSLLGCL